MLWKKSSLGYEFMIRLSSLNENHWSNAPKKWIFSVIKAFNRMEKSLASEFGGVEVFIIYTSHFYLARLTYVTVGGLQCNKHLTSTN